jgi:periplasmic protein TonB
MATASYRPAANRHRASPGRRAASFLLALLIEVLLLLAFLTINFRERPRPEFEGGRLTTFDVSAESEQDRSMQRQPQEQEQVKTRPPRVAPPVPRPAVELPERPLDMLIVSKEVYEASDISRLGSNAPGYVKSARSGGSGRDPGDSERVGTAPDGQPLYAAEWYREPTNQELSAYLPKSLPEGGGWGLIACRTAERYRVTDCVELGNSPPGSHLAGAVRQAAWQFLVRPPRVGGRPMIGEWVRIRIDYSRGPPTPSR